MDFKTYMENCDKLWNYIAKTQRRGIVKLVYKRDDPKIRWRQIRKLKKVMAPQCKGVDLFNVYSKQLTKEILGL